MKILFWGTPTYAVPTLNALFSAGHEIVGVVTQPDRRRGRGKQLIPSPVKARAIELAVPVFTPEKIRKDFSVRKTSLHSVLICRLSWPSVRFAKQVFLNNPKRMLERTWLVVAPMAWGWTNPMGAARR